MQVVVLTGTVEKEGNQFVSICPELDIASFSDTVEDAFDMLEEALEVHLEALVDIGTLDLELRECGVTVREDAPCEGEEVTLSVVPGKIYRAYVMKIPVLTAG